MLDHIGEEGCDKEFFSAYHDNIDGTCSLVINAYFDNEYGPSNVLNLGVNSSFNKHVRWGNPIPFNETTNIYVRSYSTLYIDYVDTYDNVNNENATNNKYLWFYINIKQILNILYNFKTNKIKYVNHFYKNDNYPSKLSEYPWHMMFVFDRENHNLYYQTLENNGTKIEKICKCSSFVTFTRSLISYSGIIYDNNFRVNNRDKRYSMDEKTILRYYKLGYMNSGNEYKNLIIWGGGSYNQ